MSVTKPIARIPLQVVVTSTGATTEGALVAVMVEDLKALEAKAALVERYETALREIVDTQGITCGDSLCEHLACMSSVTSKIIAEEGLSLGDGR